MMTEEEKGFVWTIAMAVFSVTLYWSSYNADLVNLFSIGDWYYYLLRKSTPVWDEILSTALYIILNILNILFVGFIYRSKEYLLSRFSKSTNYYLNLLIGTGIGITPMVVYYVVLGVAEIFWPGIIGAPAVTHNS